MRKLLVLLLVIGLVIGCVGVVSAAALTIQGLDTAKIGDTVTFSVENEGNVTYSWTIDNQNAGGNGNSLKTV